MGFAVGISDGAALRARVGTSVGVWVGVSVGTSEGTPVALLFGSNVGVCVGAEVGTSVGKAVGICVGASVGVKVGTCDGPNDGAPVCPVCPGSKVGVSVGTTVGSRVGILVRRVASVGANVGDLELMSLRVRLHRPSFANSLFLWTMISAGGAQVCSYLSSSLKDAQAGDTGALAVGVLVVLAAASETTPKSARSATRRTGLLEVGIICAAEAPQRREPPRLKREGKPT